MESIRDFLKGVVRDVDARLAELIPLASTPPAKLHDAIRWSVFAGGKRIRPAILLSVGEACFAERSSLLNTAAAVEMIHTYSLIHDDLPAMDDDDLRRGKATCHIQFGEATAILAGDVLQTMAFAAIADDAGLSSEVKVDLVSLLARASGTPVGMVSGQQLDLEAEGKDVSIEDISKIHSLKTGALIKASAVAGGVIAGVPDAELRLIETFGERLGLLFQITDDLLDVTQETATLGKTAGKDLASKKATYPAFYGNSRTIELIDEVRSSAIEALDNLQRDTDLLRAFVDLVADRRS